MGVIIPELVYIIINIFVIINEVKTLIVLYKKSYRLTDLSRGMKI